MFVGRTVDSINLKGVDHVICFTATGEDVVQMRHCSVTFKRSGNKVPRVELEDVGPSCELVVRRHRFATEDLLKAAIFKPKQGMKKKVKNIEYDTLGNKEGRVHLKKQNLKDLVTKKMKGLDKRRSIDEDGENLMAKAAKKAKASKEAQ